MNGLELLLVILGAIAVTAFAQQRALQPALIITIVGLAASFIPGIPRLDLDSDVILGVVLPPLLYSAALSFSFISFMRKLGPILVLGVGLVVVTAFGVAVLGSWVVPGLSLSAALVLGAVVAPPDAVSAVSIGRALGLRKRVLSVLTGESLVNDAAALTVLSVAIASVTGSHTFIHNPVLLFLYGAVVGIAAGFALAVVALAVRRQLRNAALETVLGLVVPFAAYMLGEELDASGVLAVVTAGFVIGTLSVRFDYETRLQERQVWDALDVLLEAFVFAYMGLQLRFVIDDLTSAHQSLWAVAGSGLLVLAFAIVVRPLWIFLTLGAGLAVEDRAEDPALVRAQRRLALVNARRTARGKPEAKPPELLTLREATVVSWTGMRGVVTIAAAAGIPATLQNGAPFPGRAEIQAIAYLVAVGTLLIQGSTLPWLIRALGTQSDDERERSRAQHELAERLAREASERVFSAFIADPPEGIDPAFVELAGERIERQRSAIRELSEETRGAAAEAMGGLMQEVITEQRKAILGAMRSGELDDDDARAFLEQVDYQEAGLSSRLRARL